MKKKACKCCNGSGKELDHVAVGVEMRKMRLAAGLSQAQLGLIMKLTSAYICDLELARRNWREDLIEKFRAACKQA